MTERELREKALEHWLRRQGRSNYAFTKSRNSALYADELDRHELRSKLVHNGVEVSYTIEPLATCELLFT